MSTTLIALIKEQLSAPVISQAASQLGESESGISKAVSALIPTVLGGFANAPTSTHGDLLETMKNAVTSGSFVDSSGQDSGGSSWISSILNTIFGGGDKLSAIVSGIANYAGINNQSASSLLNMVTGISGGVLGKYALENQLNVNQFGSLLNEQKSVLGSILPVGFNLNSLGFGNWFGESTGAVLDKEDLVAANAYKSVPPRKVNTHNDNQSEGKLWRWLLPLLLLMLLGWFIWKQCVNKPASTSVAMGDSAMVGGDSVATDDLDDAMMATKETVLVTLPSGKTIQAFKGGIEDQIVAFLQSDEYKNATEDQLKDRWFNFDNLNFEFGTVRLTPESQVQLNNLKAILSEFPNAKIKIGAYTDKKGDPAVNLKLSQQRADAVKTSLNSTQVKEAEGYGSKFATVDADASDEERAVDRKTAVRFVK